MIKAWLEARIVKDWRIKRAKKLVPAIESFCQQHGIAISENTHGYQFRKAEYVLTWNIRTNKVIVQYRISGHDKPAIFKGEACQTSPKVLQALQSLAQSTNV